MSESDEDKPKEFFWLRARALVATREVRRLARLLDEAQEEKDRLREELQAICPHLDITECPAHEAFLDGMGFPPSRIETRRRCEDCWLVHAASHPSTPLFGREPTRTMTPEEFMDSGDEE